MYNLPIKMLLKNQLRSSKSRNNKYNIVSLLVICTKYVLYQADSSVNLKKSTKSISTPLVIL